VRLRGGLRHGRPGRRAGADRPGGRQGLLPALHHRRRHAHRGLRGERPAYDQLFGAIAEQLTDEQLTQLNAGYDVDGEPADDIARDFLVENSILSG
jgi:hypothetical protein